MLHYLRDAIQKGIDIYIFGCGVSGEKVYTALTISGVIVKGFFDNAYPEGCKLGEKHILPLQKLYTCDKEKTYIIIASGARKAIEEQLEKVGVKHVIDRRELAVERRSEYQPIVFETCEKPEVSILVTAYNEWQYTYNCLYSLSKHMIWTPYEIIFGDDVSTDRNKEAEKYFQGICAVHNKKRLNYLKNVNNIAKLAKGEYILLLANDTVILQDYWIDKMLNMMKADSNIGMLSGKYWVPLTGKYDTACNYGENWEKIELSPDTHTQAVEYVPPVAAMIRKSVWEKVGGFSEEFLPAYWEDNDLCMKIISAGYKCVYAPEIETIHFRGVTYEKNVEVSKIMEQNFNLFIDKWKCYKSC